MKILILDDDADFLEIFQASLLSDGHEVVCAKTVTEARIAFCCHHTKGVPFDLFLADIGTPEMLGTTLHACMEQHLDGCGFAFIAEFATEDERDYAESHALFIIEKSLLTHPDRDSILMKVRFYRAPLPTIPDASPEGCI